MRCEYILIHKRQLHIAIEEAVIDSGIQVWMVMWLTLGELPYVAKSCRISNYKYREYTKTWGR